MIRHDACWKGKRKAWKDTAFQPGKQELRLPFVLSFRTFDHHEITPRGSMAETRDRQVVLWVVGIAALLAWVLAWGLLVRANPEWLAQRDWIAFDRAAEAFRTGEFAEAYRDAARTDLYLLYPPYVLYAFAPLAFLPPGASYVLALGSGVALFILAWVALARWLRLDGRGFAIASVVIALSGWWLMYLPTAQLSPVYLLAMVAGGVLWSRGRLALAGLAFALLWVKPNLAVVLLALLGFSRSWRVAGGMLTGLAVLLIVSLPLGDGVWPAFYEASLHLGETIRDGRLPIHRQLTLFALLETSLPASRAVRLAIWAAAILPLGLATLWVWRRIPAPSDLPRRLGIAALFMVAANPYLFFYDGILLILPAAAWFALPASYRDVRLRRAAGFCALGAYVWFFQLGRPAVPLGGVGVFVSLWLLCEVADLSRTVASRASPGRSSGPATPDGPDPAVVTVT